MSSINMSTGVSIEKLDGTNYHVWKFKMQLVLEDKELFGVIDGTDVKAEGSAEWVKRDKKARVTISLSIRISLSILSFDQRASIEGILSICSYE